MTLVTKQIRPNSADDTQFRDFVTKVRAGITDLGWVRTADTGQIDPTTVVKPTVTGTVAGYDIFRMADSLQATAPCFLKVEYGVSASGATFNGLWITVGTATNGAGTLQGNVSFRSTMQMQAADTNLRNCTFAGGTNRIAVLMWEGVATTLIVCGWFIERSHADDGSDTAERLDVVVQQTASSPRIDQLPASGSVPAAQTTMPVLVGASGSALMGTDVGVFPIFPNMAGPLRNPLIGLLVYVNTDLAHLSDVPVTMYGTSRTYRSHGATEFSTSTSNGFSKLARSDLGLLVLVS